ncbi:MAG: copper amine oxidase N-terminal domain-containing protein [Oscillospiraceae bacterium]|nr:copper amine oxidase N-terminal domain-containing protein [Oscillospiraceae bacterium]
MKTKNKTNLNKKILCIIAVLILAAFSVMTLSSCDKSDFYNLAGNLLKDGGKAHGNLYYFTANLNIKISKNYLYQAGISYDLKDSQFDSIPDELNFVFDGKVKNDPADASKTMFEITSVLNDNLKTVIYGKNNLLYFELNDESRVILDFLSATGFFDPAIKSIVENQISYNNGTVIYFNFSDINLSWFDKYISNIDKTFTITSNVKYDSTSDSVKDFSVPDLDKSKAAYFGDIKTKTDRELLKVQNYRYTELSIVLSADSSKNNFINILATRENGKTDLLEKVKIDYDISKIRNDASLVYSANFLPMRYILELLGETVNWNSANKKAYIVNSDGKEVYFDGSLVNSTTYISLTQLIANTPYQIDVGTIGDYIEFKIDRQ